MNKFAFLSISGLLIKIIFLAALSARETKILGDLEYFTGEKQIFDKKDFDHMKKIHTNYYALQSAVFAYSCIKFIIAVGFCYYTKIYKKIDKSCKIERETLKESIVFACTMCLDAIFDFVISLALLIAFKIDINPEIGSVLLATVVIALKTFVLHFAIAFSFLFCYRKCGKYTCVLVFSVIILYNVASYTLTEEYTHKNLRALRGYEHKREIRELAENVGFDANRIKVKETTEYANAAHSGQGRNGLITITSKAIEILTKEQVISMIAHEIGHWYHKHQYMQYKEAVYWAIYVALFFYILHKKTHKNAGSVILQALYVYHAVLSVQSIIFLIKNSSDQWYIEYEADNYALSIGHGKHLGSGLLKSESVSYVNTYASELYAKYMSTHPPTFTRIEYMEDTTKFDKLKNSIWRKII